MGWFQRAMILSWLFTCCSLCTASVLCFPGDASLDDLLLVLSDSYEKAGNKAAARACLQALSVRQPGLGSVQERLKQLDTTSGV